MAEKRLSVSKSGSVARVTLSRPEVHNAFDAATVAALTRTFAELSKDRKTRVVVLAGEGKNFCAGADAAWMRASAEASKAANKADALKLHRMLEAFYMLPQPTVARVQGAAFGGGVGLACCADVTVAAENAVFCLSETKLGILPAVIGPFVARKIGIGGLRAYGLSAKKLTAAEALSAGLAQETVPEADLDAAVDRWTGEFLRNGPGAMAALKKLSEKIYGRPLSAVARYTAPAIAEARAGAEGREGIGAFLEKRPPSWRAAKG